MYNKNKNTSLKFYVDNNSSTITEYSANTKISNIGVLEQKNVGQTQNIKIGNAQTLDIGSTQKTIIGTSKTIDVPTYTFNTTTMTMNNNTSTTINTSAHSLTCKTDTILASQSYSLTAKAGTIICASVGSWSAPTLTLLNVVATGTFNGNLNGHVEGTMNGSISTGSYWYGVTDVSGSTSPIPIPAFSANPPDAPANVPLASFPGVETPKTPYTFTKILQLYVEYLKEEFKYLINIFR